MKRNYNFTTGFFLLTTSFILWQSGCSTTTGERTQTDPDVQSTTTPMVVAIDPVRFVTPDQTGQQKLESAPLAEILEQAKQPAAYQPPTDTELKNFETLVSRTMRTADVEQFCAEVVGDWNRSGWQIHQDPGHNFIIISEQPDQRRARGVYTIRLNSDSSILLQAPHRFYDRGTGTIATSLFEEHEIRACVWNSVHRKRIDIAHDSQHFINAFTAAVINIFPDTIVAQIHGFAGDKKSGVARTTSVIVSDGTKFPARIARATTDELKKKFGDDHSRLYPLEIRELGGTENAQGNFMRDSGSPRFLHIELNAEFRQQLIDSASTRAEFFEAIRSSEEL